MHKGLRARLEQRRAEDGFTLIELLVVVVIIGILIAIAIPLYMNYQDNARNKSAQSDLRGAIYSMEQCMVSQGNYGTAGTISHTASWSPCTGQMVSLSKDTTMNMTIRASGASWTATSQSGTAGKVYTYDSLVAGSIS